MAEKTEKLTVEALQDQLKAMGEMLERFGITPPKARTEKQHDYVEFGSERHAAVLGLSKAAGDDKLVYDGWTLVDPTAFGFVREDVIFNILKGKVHILKAGAPPIPKEPTLWRPSPEDQPI